MRRRAITVLVILGVSAIGIALIRSSASKAPEVASEQTRKQKPKQPKDVFELERAQQGPKPQLESRFGDDDGFVAALFYGGDTMGNLEVCG
jgi:hypothetical protein